MWNVLSPRVVNLCRTDVRGAASIVVATALASSNKERITRSRKGRAIARVVIIVPVLLSCLNYGLG